MHLKNSKKNAKILIKFYRDYDIKGICMLHAKKIPMIPLVGMVYKIPANKESVLKASKLPYKSIQPKSGVSNNELATKLYDLVESLDKPYVAAKIPGIDIHPMMYCRREIDLQIPPFNTLPPEVELRVKLLMNFNPLFGNRSRERKTHAKK